MKRLAFAIGLLVLGLGAASPASADFAVIKFNSGYCRIWTDTAYGPQDGRYLWFRHHWRWHHHHWHYRFHGLGRCRPGHASGGLVAPL